MLNVEIKTKLVKNYQGEEEERKYVVINGIIDEESRYLDPSPENSRDYVSVTLRNEEAVEALVNYSFGDVKNTFSQFTFNNGRDWWEYYFSVTVFCDDYWDEYPVPGIWLSIEIESYEWSKPWTVSSFIQEFKQIAESENNEDRDYIGTDDDIEFGIIYYPESEQMKIKEEIEIAMQWAKKLIEETNRKLLENLDKEALTEFFQFPEEYKAACKQYLVYFAQFMADLGVAVSTEIKDEAHQTLFRVMPQDKTEGLEKIREALGVYLNAPGSQDFKAQIASQQDIAAIQWKFNVAHLESQVELARSMLQLKDATIEQLQISNYQLKNTLSSMDTNKKDTSGEEIIIDDVLSVKKYEKFGAILNLPGIVKKLKRKWGRS